MTHDLKIKTLPPLADGAERADTAHAAPLRADNIWAAMRIAMTPGRPPDESAAPAHSREYADGLYEELKKNVESIISAMSDPAGSLAVSNKLVEMVDTIFLLEEKYLQDRGLSIGAAAALKFCVARKALKVDALMKTMAFVEKACGLIGEDEKVLEIFDLIEDREFHRAAEMLNDIAWGAI